MRKFQSGSIVLCLLAILILGNNCVAQGKGGSGWLKVFKKGGGNTKPPKELIIDLNLTPGNLSIPIKTGETYVVRVRGIVPSKIREYSIAISQISQAIPALTWPDASKKIQAEQALVTNGIVMAVATATCSALSPVISAVKNATDEASYFAAINNLRQTATAGYSICSEFTEAMQLLLQYENGIEYQIEKVKSNTKITVTVTRKEGTREVKTEAVYATPKKGAWEYAYGPFLRYNQWTNEEVYYLDPISPTAAGATNQYTITRSNNRRSLTFLPAIMFYYTPAKGVDRDIKLGFTGGLGYDLSNISVIGGIHVTFFSNITLNAGFVYNEIQLLRGNYKEGQVINSNLSSDQLHDKYFRFNPIIGISFRLDKPLFGSGSSSTTSPAHSGSGSSP